MEEKVPDGPNTRIITIANQKGGVGKTTVAHCLTAGLNEKGYKTLAIDADPQGNLVYLMNGVVNAPGVYDVLKGTLPLKNAVQRTSQGDVIAGNRQLASADVEFTNEPGGNFILAEAIDPLNGVYDFIIIDTPPTLGFLTFCTLTAAHDVIIPMGADTLSLQGLSQLHSTITKVRKRCNPQLNIAGILVTRYNARTLLSQELRETIGQAAQTIGTTVFEGVIRETISIKEAQTKQTDIFSYAPAKGAAADFNAFIDEYLKENSKNGEEKV